MCASVTPALNKNRQPGRAGGYAHSAAANWWQVLGIQANSECSLGTMRIFRAMFEQAQEQALKIRAWHENHGVAQWARCPAPSRITGTARTGRFRGS